VIELTLEDGDLVLEALDQTGFHLRRISEGSVAAVLLQVAQINDQAAPAAV
jgi:hypothetical protein